MSRAGVNELMTAISGRRPGRDAPNPPEIFEGVVRSVGLAGMTFTVNAGDKFFWGPAPYPVCSVEATGGGGAHDHAATPPQPGWRCLVILVPPKMKPWVIAVWPA